jgi:hypothetical protein
MFGCILGGLPMTETCDLCHSSALESIDDPTLGRRDKVLALITTYVTRRARTQRAA